MKILLFLTIAYTLVIYWGAWIVHVNVWGFRYWVGRYWFPSLVFGFLLAVCTVAVFGGFFLN